MISRVVAWSLICCVVALGGCNMMQGLGKDVKQVGSKIEKKAEEKKK